MPYIGTCFRFYTQLRVQKQNKAFAYRIYSHFTQQCKWIQVPKYFFMNQFPSILYFLRAFFCNQICFVLFMSLTFNTSCKMMKSSLTDKIGQHRWTQKWHIRFKVEPWIIHLSWSLWFYFWSFCFCSDYFLGGNNGCQNFLIKTNYKSNCAIST